METTKRTSRQDVTNKIVALLNKMPNHGCMINGEDFDIQMKDGNSFACIGIELERGFNDLVQIKCWYEHTGDFFVGVGCVEEQTLWDIYNAMPRERMIYVGFVDGVNQSGKTYTIGHMKTFCTDESEIIDELTKFMPGTEWKVDDVGQYVCYPFANNDKQYFIAEVCVDV